jgi:FkbM family methyltransferase
MESEKRPINSMFKSITKKNKFYIILKKLIIIIIIPIMLLDFFINIGILKLNFESNTKLKKMFLNLKNDLYVIKLKMKSFMLNESEQFNEIINEEYIQRQNNFCENTNKYYNDEYENKIKLQKVNFNNKTYNMFIYKQNDTVSNYISKLNVWEKYDTDKILEALNYFSKRKNLTENDIYILDIGGNVGWYTFLLGKYGYKIITFEPNKINYYILNKNYCLNKGLNITLINKGLFLEEKKCYIHSYKSNIGNGNLNCNKRPNKNYINNGEIILTKLSNYVPFFINKNLALIKIDIEGLEEKAFESGIELITEYHVPFIFMEIVPQLLISYGTEPKKFLEMFLNNGYKINILVF